MEKFTNADRCALYGRYFPYANWAQWKDVDGECVHEIIQGVTEGKPVSKSCSSMTRGIESGRKYLAQLLNFMSPFFLENFS